MRAKELMIGDWVLFNNEKCRISSIENYGGLVGVENDDICDLVADAELEPIPLTPEILEANIFRFVGKYEWRDDIFVSVYRYRDENLEIKFEIKYTPNYDGFTWKGIEINNVHKLQHALRLCGLNEFADNFQIE